MFKNDTPLERKGRFTNPAKPGRAGNGKHVNLESCVSMRDIAAENETERESEREREREREGEG